MKSNISIKEKERELFSKWKSEQQYPSFISDGVFDEECYNRQDIKILFVLKEANWENGTVDLCKYLLSEESSGYWKTWNNIARWTKAILDGGDYPEYISCADKTFWLKKIAFLNLKKKGGTSKAKDKEIQEYATRDKKFLLQQIELYYPDIIICCGRGEGKNADILHDTVLPKENVSEWKQPCLRYNYFIYSPSCNKEIPVVSFCHPQMWGGHVRFKKRYDEMKFIGAFLKTTYLKKTIKKMEK
ncbi:MAG: hypothetical protein ACI3XI_00865 [Eubacteriales bacterium]